ncbi:MarR family transcriptional regulator [Brevibacillus fluminis]|uniref:MarR family transcriptional regulator n=1 Tax=Brevibacillus fluminis TaxID=511487 RepID=A0A3M8CW93_9BACL|nr:MarR family transcriptional regulator [Brevibacillus fluminis]RNB79497.1 MarR family transcriptional regulator [Brevibacillus fluminis]
MPPIDEELLPNELDVLNRLTDYKTDYSAMKVCTHLYWATQRMRNKIEQKVLSEYNLSWTAFSILYDLWIWESMETRKLAVSEGVTVATISSIANTLERKELCRREIDPNDRRMVRLRITEKGRQIIEELYPKFNQGESQVVKGLSMEEQKAITKMLRKMIENIDEM